MLKNVCGCLRKLLLFIKYIMKELKYILTPHI